MEDNRKGKSEWGREALTTAPRVLFKAQYNKLGGLVRGAVCMAVIIGFRLVFPDMAC